MGVGALVVTMAVIGLFVAVPIMLLWNWLLPELFGVPEINFWQALGIYLLAGFIFKTSVSTDD
jgi:hypothetical protein